MKRHINIIAFLMMLFFGLSVRAQNNPNDIYFVTVIKGKVTKADKAPLKVGEKLHYRDKVIFSSKEDMVVLLHPEKGRFVVTPTVNPDDPSAGLFAFLSDNLHLQSHRVSLSSRGDPDLEAFFSVNPAINENLLLIGETKIGIHSSDYKINNAENDFFFLQYTPAGGKPSSNKLRVINDSLVIKKEDLLFNGSYPADSIEVKLGFMKNYAADRKITKISSFKPVFMTVQECRDFLLAVKQLKKKSKEEIIEESVTELYYFYGKPDQRTVQLIYDSL